MVKKIKKWDVPKKKVECGSVGEFLRYIKEYDISDDAQVFVQMPCCLSDEDWEKNNLGERFIIPSEHEGDVSYTKAWGPMFRRNRDELYVEIYY